MLEENRINDDGTPRIIGVLSQIVYDIMKEKRYLTPKEICNEVIKKRPTDSISCISQAYRGLVKKEFLHVFRRQPVKSGVVIAMPYSYTPVPRHCVQTVKKRTKAIRRKGVVDTMPDIVNANYFKYNPPFPIGV